MGSYAENFPAVLEAAVWPELLLPAGVAPADACISRLGSLVMERRYRRYISSLRTSSQTKMVITPPVSPTAMPMTAAASIAHFPLLVRYGTD